MNINSKLGFFQKFNSPWYHISYTLSSVYFLDIIFPMLKILLQYGELLISSWVPSSSQLIPQLTTYFLYFVLLYFLHYILHISSIFSSNISLYTFPTTCPTEQSKTVQPLYIGGLAVQLSLQCSPTCLGMLCSLIFLAGLRLLCTLYFLYFLLS